MANALNKVNSGGIEDGSIVNADIKSDAAIAASKLSGVMPLAGGTFTGDVTFDNQSNAGKDIIWDESDDALEFADDTKAVFGSGSDLTLQHTSGHSRITHGGAGNLIVETTATDSDLVLRGKDKVHIQPNDGNEGVICNAGGSTELYFNNVKKLQTDTAGTLIVGDLLLNSADDHKIKMGAGNDLEIYHSGSHSHIKDSGTGHLQIDGSRVQLRNVANDDPMVDCTGGGTVEIYHNGSKKLESISTGINVTGGIRLGGNNAVNELDDYETGTFTPSIAAVSAGWNSRTGTYTKVGDLVTVFIHLSTASGGSTNGDQVAITGLPFTSENTNGQAGAVVGYHNGIINDDYNFPFLVTSANTTNINWHKGNGGAFTGNDMNTSHFGLHVSCTYKAA